MIDENNQIIPGSECEHVIIAQGFWIASVNYECPIHGDGEKQVALVVQSMDGTRYTIPIPGEAVLGMASALVTEYTSIQLEKAGVSVEEVDRAIEQEKFGSPVAEETKH